MHNSLTIRYARALMGAADDGKMRQAVDKDLDSMQKLFSDSPEIPELVRRSGKNNVTATPVSEFLQTALKLTDLTCNLLKIITERKRFGLLPEIILAYTDEVKRQNGILPAQVTSARKLEDSEKEKIRIRLAEQTNHEIEITWHEDASVLGGIKVKIRDRVFDGTLETRIKQLKDHLLLR